MIMDGMLSNISQRLHEVNTLLATYGQGVLSFEQVLPPSLFYQDFNDTNLLVKEAACLVKENPGQLLDFSSSDLEFVRFLFPSFGNEQIPLTRQDTVAGGGL